MAPSENSQSQPSPAVLVIDDEPGHRLMVRAVLEDVGWRVLEAEDGASGLSACSSSDQLDAMLLDMRLPDQDGMSLLTQIKAIQPQLPVIMFTAFGSVGSAVEAMKMGAFDYLTKPADNEELKAVLEKARNYIALVRENKELRRALGEEDGHPRLIGHGLAMLRVLDLIEQVGPTEATVLVLGESGTGKELVVNAIHAASDRKNGPLVQVNCAALPGELLESELFGYVKGAFTGASGNKPGRFQMAEKGTLFLDEIGDMPLPLQAKLLRALQERTVEPAWRDSSGACRCAHNRCDPSRPVEAGGSRSIPGRPLFSAERPGNQAATATRSDGRLAGIDQASAAKAVSEKPQTHSRRQSVLPESLGWVSLAGERARVGKRFGARPDSDPLRHSDPGRFAATGASRPD